MFVAFDLHSTTHDEPGHQLKNRVAADSDQSLHILIWSYELETFMPRVNLPASQPIYDAAQAFVDEALRRDGSLFTPGQAIWT